jgi:hypothetical protein
VIPSTVGGMTSTRILGAGAALLAVLLAGSGATASLSLSQGTGPGGCYDPVAFGAIPDDGIFDRVPIQAAMDAATSAGGGTVCLGSGRWTLNKAPAGSFNRFAALSTHAARLTIAGTGPGTVLELVGDQGLSDTYVLSFDPGAGDVTVERLTIDTSAATNTDEQTHAIEIGSGVCSDAIGTCSKPVTDVTVRDVRFVHPPTPGMRKGDCIRLLGNTEATRVLRATIIGSSFINCARSGIGVQRNVNSLAVLGNHFDGVIGDTAFDGEATGGGWDDGLRLIGNSFANGPTTFSVALTSYRHATITGNTFSGRGLGMHRTQDVVVADNTFDVTALTSDGVVNSTNVAGGLKIDNNVIRRHGVAGTGIRIMPHSGGIPQQITVTGNTIVVEGDSNGFAAEGVHHIGIRDNDITLVDPAPNGHGIYLRATVADMDGVMITGNTVTGSTYFAAVRIAASPHPVFGVTVALNSSVGGVRSLQCEQDLAGNFPRPIVSLGNRWAVSPTCVATLQSGQ